jgi:hypothetical protein
MSDHGNVRWRRQEFYQFYSLRVREHIGDLYSSNGGVSGVPIRPAALTDRNANRRAWLRQGMPSKGPELEAA